MHQQHILDTIQRHCSYLRKCVLTLIAIDFNQLTSKPMLFNEFMAIKNQVVRYSLFFTFSVFVLAPYYLEIILNATCTAENCHAFSLWDHFVKHNFKYDIVSSIVFHIVILGICLRCLIIMISADNHNYDNKCQIL